MSLDGLRAWIGEVERKLGIRTKVMLVLAAIGIGLGGASLYVAIDSRDSSVSESDVQELQQQLEAQIGTGGATAAPEAGLVQLESELRSLQAEVDALQAESGDLSPGGGAGGGKGGNGNRPGVDP